MITLELGAATSCFRAGAQEFAVALGVAVLRERWLRAAPPTAGGMEAAIETVEDAVMPLHGRWPADDLLEVRSGEPALRTVASLLGGAADREALEDLFGRAAAVAQGRPVASAPLLADGSVVAALVILRETMHHLGFQRLRLDAR